MNRVLVAIKDKIESVERGFPDIARSSFAGIVAEYHESRAAFFLGKVSGYRLARSVIVNAKTAIKSIQVINSRVITIRDYSYATVLRTISTLDKMVKQNEKKAQEQKNTQARRLQGQVQAMLETLNELRKDYPPTSLMPS